MGWTLFCCDVCKGKVKNVIFLDIYFFFLDLKVKFLICSLFFEFVMYVFFKRFEEVC